MAFKRFFLLLLLALPKLALTQVVLATQDSSKIRADNAKEFIEYSLSYSIEDLVASQQGSSVGDIHVSSAPPLSRYRVHLGDDRREDYLMSATANSDLIVIGDPIERTSDLVAAHRFIFSDYTVAVNRVLYANKLTVLPGQHIIVTRPGGIMSYGGKKVHASVEGFNLFHLNQPHLFFLRILPNGSFLVFAEMAYSLETNSVLTHPWRRDANVILDKQVFLEDVDKAIKRIHKGED